MFSSAAGPFQHRDAFHHTQTPFQKLKPVCVELLSLTGRTSGPSQSAQLVECLGRLKITLRALLSDADQPRKPSSVLASTSKLVPHSTEAILTPSLINYVFYPLSELISAAPSGINSLPESVIEATLHVLALLCSEWWTAWASPTGSSQAANNQWQVWCDLVILSSSVLGSPSKSDVDEALQKAKVSDEVKLSALEVLSELLSPRFRAPAPRHMGPSASTKEREWEWDGVSELPLLDEEGDLPPVQHRTQTGTEGQVLAEMPATLVYPSREHLSYAATHRVAKGAISFVLSSSFALAESSTDSTETRTAAIYLARHALLLWIGGTCQSPSSSFSQSSEGATWLSPCLYYIDVPPTPSTSHNPASITAQKAVAQRLRPLLPGITSSLTRLATSRLKSRKDGVVPKPTPSSTAAGAVDLLGDLFRATLSEDCLGDIITRPAPLHHSRPSPNASINVTDLEDFADRDAREEPFLETVDVSLEDEAQGQDHAKDSPSDSANKDAQWALSTLAQVHLALKTLSSLAQPSLAGTSLPSPIHSSVQKAILRLAVQLLSECAGSFAWLDEQLEGMARLDATTSSADGVGSAGSDSSSVSTLLTWIVDLASDYNVNSVAESAKAAFFSLQASESRTKSKGRSVRESRFNDGSALWSLLTQALSSLPAAITAQNDGSASRLALRVSTILDLFAYQRASQSSTGLAGLAKLSQDIQQSFVRLMRPLQVERLNHVEEAGEMPGSTMWRLQPVFAGLELSTSSQLSRMFFNMGRSLALSLVQELKLGRQRTSVDASQVFSVIIFLIERASQLRSVRLDSRSELNGTPDQGAARRNQSLVTLIVAADMLRGASSCLDNLEVGLHFAGLTSGAAQATKQARKVAHKLGKKVSTLVMDMLDGDAEEAIATRDLIGRRGRTSEGFTDSKQANDDDASLDVGQAGASSESTLVERLKGISFASDDIEAATPDRHGPALDLGFVRAANLAKSSRSPANPQLAIQHRYRQAERNLDLSNALLFALLSSASKLLGQSFRSLLLRGAYPLISGMSAFSSASSELVRQSSTSAMKDIAFHTAYADTKNCLLDHADYILGSACQRLISGLDEELRAVVSTLPAVSGGSRTAVLTNERSGGGSSENAVVLPLVSAQRAPFVLVEMIRVLGSEIVPMVEDAIDEILDALDRFHQHPTICDGLLAVLDSILETMAAEQLAQPPKPPAHAFGLISPVAHEHHSEMDDFAAWLASRKREQTAFDESADGLKSSSPDKEQDDKPSKSQQVASQILTKAASFLTHPSAVLRSRVLGLLRHGIETLAPQARTAELLPIVNSAWPFVMTRLGASYSHAKSSSTSNLTPIIDLNPASIGSAQRLEDDAWYRKLEESLIERDPQVWVAAASFVASAAEHVPDFVGKRVVQDAWPRFKELLTLLRWKFDPRVARVRDGQAGRAQVGVERAATMSLLDSEVDSHAAEPMGRIQDWTAGTHAASLHRPVSTCHVHVDSPFILPSASSIPAQLTLCILSTLTAVVRHLNTRMPDDAAWSITTHSTLLDLLDRRQPPLVIRGAEELYIELGRRNPEATAWALRAAFPQTAAKALQAEAPTPCFMHHARANVHAETVHCIVSSFAAV